MAVTDQYTVGSDEALRAVIGEPIEGIELKVYDHLVEEAIAFIERAPFLVLSTADADGNMDASPKGDNPGFVEVEDTHTLLIPDRPGNKLVFGHRNILENPHVAVLLMIPGTTETLRVNGTAELCTDPELLARMAARGKPAVLVIRVRVNEVFFHCSKAFVRSKLWKPETWPERHKISFGEMFAKRLGAADDPSVASTIDDMVEDDARNNL